MRSWIASRQGTVAAWLNASKRLIRISAATTCRIFGGSRSSSLATILSELYFKGAQDEVHDVRHDRPRNSSRRDRRGHLRHRDEVNTYDAAGKR